MSTMEPRDAAMIGGIIGGVMGGTLGLGVCMWLIPGTLLFPGDTILAGAVICGALGYALGEPFVDFLLRLLHHWF